MKKKRRRGMIQTFFNSKEMFILETTIMKIEQVVDLNLVVEKRK